MEVIVAKSAGFCYGVNRAVSLCKETAEKCNGCVTLGPIIHNDHVIRELENNGVQVISDVNKIAENMTVVIRSHGAGEAEYQALVARNANIVDATCPDVKRIHDIVHNESNEKRLVIIIGQRQHPEIEAISGWCSNHIIFEAFEELNAWLSNEDNAIKPLSFVFQTTSKESVFKACCEIIKKVCTNQRIFDTICNATLKRQQESEEIAKVADTMIVIGDRNSSNSLKLSDICKQYCSNVLFIQNADDINYACVKQSEVVGITAGASTPAFIIKEVTRKMKEETNMDGIQVEQEVNETLPEPEEKQVETTEVSEAVETAVVEEVNDTTDEVVAEEIIADEVVEETAVPEVTTEDADVSESTDSATEAEGDDSESFEEMLEKSIKTLRTGEKVTGIITSITSTEVAVDLGAKQSGYIPITEFFDEENTNIDDIIKVGDTIESFVMRVNDVEGMIMLSKKRLDAIKNWDIVEAAKENKTTVTGVVAEENKGGIVVNVKGVRVFVPASQTGLPKSAPMSELLKKQVNLRITEVNQSRRRVVGSIREVQRDERREKAEQVWNDIEVGKQYEGVVKSMTTYGVFVDIGGVDGMIHISELSWTRIKQPSEVMSVGDEVSVYVLSFDKETRKISLGYKKSEDNPWTKFTTQCAVGDVVNVKIVKMMPFGAFAEIFPGVDGLIHISQITDRRIGLPSEVLSDGQEVDVKITEIDTDRKKVSLSIRALIEPDSQPLDDVEVDEVEHDDGAPVILYDTDAPPPMEEEEVEVAEEVAEIVEEPDVTAE
ncbi:MAG: bifunctional 4-hydroxy-3-methylbut-2-enyl diphosphate reductase/30S ribosomal protein S1 [Oscillospiraceae bacterium]|nr:bifunctional 4-hydroxy-3-methylbut-2-enyl diphosphate reductase/30S ribosomal protein S1 [Oscillospiraceae bacterium]